MNNKFQEELEVKTVYGYSVKDLVIIAELLRENQISIDDLKQNVDMVRVGVNIANKIQEEALDELNRMAYGDCMGDEHIARIHSRKILQELVDKETPLNLPLHHGVYMQCKCEAMNDVHSNYCWNCGQHIKLSETNE